jgi:hypothetical protein
LYLSKMHGRTTIKNVESNWCFSFSYGKRFRITYLNIVKRISDSYRKN